MTGSPSVAAQVVVVCDAAGDQGAGPSCVAAYAGAVWRAATGSVPGHHGPAVAAAEAEIGVENAGFIADWVARQCEWIETAAAALDAAAELGPQPRELPPQARAAGAVAQLLASAAGDNTAEIIWAGACASAQWIARFTGDEIAVTEMRTADPLVEAAYRWLADDECLRIATGVRESLTLIDELAGETAA